MILLWCDQCDYNKAKHQTGLTYHKQSKHEGVRYVCNQCEYEATKQGNLTIHKQNKDEGVKI